MASKDRGPLLSPVSGESNGWKRERHGGDEEGTGEEEERRRAAYQRPAVLVTPDGEPEEPDHRREREASRQLPAQAGDQSDSVPGPFAPVPGLSHDE